MRKESGGCGVYGKPDRLYGAERDGLDSCARQRAVFRPTDENAAYASVPASGYWFDACAYPQRHGCFKINFLYKTEKNGKAYIVT